MSVYEFRYDYYWAVEVFHLDDADCRETACEYTELARFIDEVDDAGFLLECLCEALEVSLLTLAEFLSQSKINLPGDFRFRLTPVDTIFH